MRRSSLIASVITLIVGPILFFMLINNFAISAAEFIAILKGLKPWPLVATAAAILVNAFLAGEKWRLVEQELCGLTPSRRLATAYSLIGTAVGQVLPTPLANVAARAGGNRLHRGEGARRGAIASIWEQLFDLAVLALLTGPALTGVAFRSPVLFGLLSVAVLIVADRVVRTTAALVARRAKLPAALTRPGLCLSLYRLSVLRAIVLLALNGSVSLALPNPVPLPELFVVVPTVAIAAVLSFLPAGLGVNEWSFVLLLKTLGVAQTAAIGFALSNRVVVAALSLALGGLGLMLTAPAPAARRAPR